MKKVIIHRQAHGFTLIVIGIVLLHITIGIAGMRKLTEQGCRRTTEQLVVNCRGLLADCERATPLRPFKGAVEPGSGSFLFRAAQGRRSDGLRVTPGSGVASEG